MPKTSFSLNHESLSNLLIRAKPLGHNEDLASLTLGFGFLYYGLARMLRPHHIVVIGSGFGYSVVCFALGLVDNGSGAYALWRYHWVWRNPEHHPPSGDGLASPADGTVVYVVEASPNEPIISCKQGVAASINDIAREDL